MTKTFRNLACAALIGGTLTFAAAASAQIGVRSSTSNSGAEDEIVVTGQKNKQEIAQALTIELGTVKNHVHNLLRKLDVCSRKHAAQLARQMLPQ